jgi:hypothetical protein
MTKLVLLGNVLVTLYLTGLIWTIQIVHYPLFAKVGAAGWPEYHAAHNAAITAIVMLPMLGELALSFMLMAGRPEPVPIWLAYLGFGLTVVIWIATGALSVPIHAQLARGLDLAVVDRLVLTNWVRTLAWTGRAALLAYALWLCMPGP